jgi:uncharacterized membrane protein YjjP (DUF1212 family)/uncharacterized membrane protein YjjB (DUF3815 family)
MPDHDPAQFRTFLVGLAEAMIAADESVDSIYDQLDRTARAYGFADTDFVVLPTLILVQTGSIEGGRVTVRSRDIDSFHFHQIAQLYRLLTLAEQAAIDPAEGIARLAQIRAMRPRFGWVVRTIGHAILAAGLSLLLVPTPEGVALAFGLGLLVGLAKLVPSRALQLILPTLAALVCAVIVYELAQFIGVGDPLRLLIAPLATFLPGAMLTTATVELASRQMIAGASRLVAGLMQLAMLAVGILAAGAIVGVGTLDYRPILTVTVVPWWVEWIGVILFALGIFLYLSVPARTFAWVVLVLLTAFAVQSSVAEFAGSTVSAFAGAVVMTPLVLWIASRPFGAPAQITFLPAFWLLVPGASGLISLTEAGDAGLSDLGTALTTVLSIALGVLIGTALFRGVTEGARRVVG